MDSYLQKLEKWIEENPTLNRYLTILEQTLKVKKTIILAILGAILILSLASGFASQLVCTSIGCLYPAYASIKALETENKDDDTQWLMYWVVFASFSLMESVSDVFIGWLPFYWLGKCAFLLWCMSPLNGAAIVYKSLILPIFRQNEEAIDKVVKQGQQKITEIAEKAEKTLQENKND